MIKALPNFLRSLLLASTLSFVAPALIVGSVLFSLGLVGYLPGLTVLTQTVTDQILNILSTFGSGSPFEGILVIALTCSLVGALFDTYAFYRCKM